MQGLVGLSQRLRYAAVTQLMPLQYTKYCWYEA